MEEVVEDIFENKTGDYPKPAYLFAHDGLLITTCFLGIIADALITWIIATNQKMRSRTNIILMNWAITDALVLSCRPSFVTSLLDAIGVNHTWSSFCIVRHVDASYQIATLVFMMAIISNTIVKTKRVSNFLILSGVYGIVAIVGFVSIILCATTDEFFITYLLVGLLFLVLIIVIIVKEVNKCCKKNPLSEKTLFRLNIGRIYVYPWIFFCLLDFVYYPSIPLVVLIVLQFIYLLGYLVSVYILAYLVYSDKYFKICFLNLFRRKADRYSNDATISFADESSDEERDEPRQVNIAFNESNVVNADASRF